MRALRLSLPLIASLSACSPSTLPEPESTPSLSLGGQASRRIESFTDLEEVRAVVHHDDSIYVATDAGLLRYAVGGDAPGATVEGAPEDIRGIVPTDEGLLLATSEGMVTLGAEGEATPLTGVPDIGHLTSLTRTQDGVVWAGGLGGVMRRGEGGWEVVGEPVQCTTLVPTPEGQLWVGTRTGLWYIEGDVVREHPISGGLPEGYVRSIVPVLPGQIMALLQGPSESMIGYFNGERWIAYTIEGLQGHAVGLGRRGRDVVLLTQHQLLTIGRGDRGVDLTPIANNEATVRSYRARLTPASQHQPPADVPGPDVLRDTQPLAAVREGGPSVDAPSFRATPVEIELPGRAYAIFVQGSDAFIPISNAGVVHLRAQGRPLNLRSQTLVPESDLQVATDSSGGVWLLSRDRHLTQLVNGRLRRVPTPSGFEVYSLASGIEGAYLIGRDTTSEEPNSIRVFVTRGGTGWRTFAQRSLALPTELISIPFANVSPDGRIWLALKVRRETGEGERMRGVAVINPNGEGVVYHHRQADRQAGGLSLPDEVESLEFDTDGNAWFGTLFGLVRLGEHQAVVFGETRGVRGEMVTDAEVAGGLVWLASGEGVGTYDRNEFSYSTPAFVQEARPTRMAADMGGHLWMIGEGSLIMHEGGEWMVLGEEDGLPTSQLRDIETDGAGRVWVLAADRILLIED